jgi:hypothetical protein
LGNFAAELNIFENTKLQFIYLSAYMKDDQATGEASSPQKRTSSTSKHLTSKFFLILWVILSYEFRIRFQPTKIFAGPDPQHWFLEPIITSS